MSIDRWLFASLPSRQMHLVRRAVLGCAFLWTLGRLPFWLDQADLSAKRADPVGLLSVFSTIGGQQLSLGQTAVVLLATFTALCLAMSLLRPRWPAVLPLSAFGFLILTSHGNSWGQVLHTENLLTLHLLVLAAAPRLPIADEEGQGHGQQRADGWPVRVMALVTAATYVVAGVAKVRYGGTEWLSGHTLQNLVAHDNLRKELLGDWSSPLAPALVKQRWIFGPGAVAAVVVELAAPLALIGRRTALLWCAAAWCFHLAVLGVLAVLFLYPLLGVAFLPLLLSFEPASSEPARSPGPNRIDELDQVEDSARPA